MRRLFLLVTCLLPACAAAVEDAPLPPGGWDLATDGTRITIRTRDADLGDVLEGLQAVMPSGVRFGAMPDETVSVSFTNIELDQLLQRLGVSYVLSYRQEDGGGAPELLGAWVGAFEAAPSGAAPLAFAGGASGGGRRGPVGEGLWAKVGLYPPDEPDPDNGVRVRSAYPVRIGLDGRIEDWPEEVAWQFVTPGMGGTTAGAGSGGATNDADTSFAVASAADEEKLYFGLHVNDDLKAREAMIDGVPKNDDAVRLVIDNLDASDPNRKMPELNMMVKRHHVMQRDPDNPDRLRPAPVQVVRSSNGATVVIRDGPDGWTVEASLDWEDLGIAPEEQADLGFNVRLVDYDEGEDDPSELTWSQAERMGGQGDDALGRLEVTPMPEP